MIKIGLYSEDRTLRSLLSSALGKNFAVQQGSDAIGMNSLISDGQCDVLILDLNSNRDALPERIQVSRELIASSLPAIVMADDGLRSTAFEMVRNGAFGYCRRPPSIRDLKTMLSRACENSALKRQLENVQLRLEEPASCDRLIGSSSHMRRVYQLVRSVSNLNAAVLVTGESGTGKELIARAIHNLGSRAERPFVAVSCGAIPETLIEAELFGHEKGAFTGTVGAREGYLEQAADGTLFLDEIGDLSLFTQVKLLRDLGQLVAEGKFRQDLFYRINVMRIESPALQEHPEDIPAIAKHILSKYSQSFQKQMDGFALEAMEMMQNYSWPGNVRELENVIQRAIILAPGQFVRAEDLTLHANEEEPGNFDAVVNIGEYQPSGSFERQIQEYKVKLAVNAVRENNGNKTLAARRLCISRAYLHRLIRLAESEQVFDQSLRETATA